MNHQKNARILKTEKCSMEFEKYEWSLENCFPEDFRKKGKSKIRCTWEAVISWGQAQLSDNRHIASFINILLKFEHKNTHTNTEANKSVVNFADLKSEDK